MDFTTVVVFLCFFLFKKFYLSKGSQSLKRMLENPLEWIRSVGTWRVCQQIHEALYCHSIKQRENLFLKKAFQLFTSQFPHSSGKYFPLSSFPNATPGIELPKENYFETNTLNSYLKLQSAAHLNMAQSFWSCVFLTSLKQKLKISQHFKP